MPASAMHFDDLFRAFIARPILQRLFLAFTLGMFMSCSMKAAEQAPEPEILSSYAP